MGMATFTAPLFCMEALRQPFSGKLLQLGQQDIHYTREAARVMMGQCGLAPRELSEELLPQTARAPENERLSAREFFLSMGFDDVFSLDVFEDKDSKNHILFDLNSKEPEEKNKEAFDFILNGGTMEHVFNVPNVLGNIHKMLKVGGRVMHFAPASNMLDHGFYSFSPCLLIEYYGANGYALHWMKLLRLQRWPELCAWSLDLYPDQDFLLTRFKVGGLDECAYTVVAVAEKLPGSTCDQTPIQGRYWDQEGRKAAAKSGKPYPKANGKDLLPWALLPNFLA